MTKQTAESLIDCSFEPEVRSEIVHNLPIESQQLLLQLTKPSTNRELAAIGRAQ